MKDRKPLDFLLPGRFFGGLVQGLPPVPAYMFHQVDAAEFERQCARIRKQRRSALLFGDLLQGRPVEAGAVLLTFDDGWSSVWSMGLPLLRRYDLRITLFLPPLCVEDSSELRSTLDDGASPAELTARDLSAHGRLTWGEVAALQASGHVDVQSHSLHHGVAFNSGALSGFIGPAGPFPLDGLAPLVVAGDSGDQVQFHPPPGTPLYDWGPALEVPRRFLPCAQVAARCQQLVADEGAELFFSRPDWQATLRAHAGDGAAGTWETDDQRRQRYRLDLGESRRLIEQRVPDARVRVLAPPWARMHEDLPQIAQECGFEFLVMGYPFRHGQYRSPLPVYPRLFGDALWTHLDGPLLGAQRWLQARRRTLRRRRAGAIP